MKLLPFSSSLAIAAIATIGTPTVVGQDGLCVSSTGNYTAVLDLYGGELGTIFLQLYYDCSFDHNRDKQLTFFIRLIQRITRRLLYIRRMSWHNESYNWDRIWKNIFLHTSRS
jgi:hypothetical protein